MGKPEYILDTFRVSPRRFGENAHWSVAMWLVPIIAVLWVVLPRSMEYSAPARAR